MTVEEYNKSVRELSHRLFGFLFKSVRDEEDANDLVQDAFMKLWQHREKVEFCKAKSWLFRTGYNAMINFVKKKGRQQRMDEGVEIPFQSKNRFELKEVIDLALENLSEQQRSIVLLRDLEGYNYKEIGDMLNLNESQVKVYLFRARKKIKDQIKDLSIINA